MVFQDNLQISRPLRRFTGEFCVLCSDVVLHASPSILWHLRDAKHRSGDGACTFHSSQHQYSFSINSPRAPAALLFTSTYAASNPPVFMPLNFPGSYNLEGTVPAGFDEFRQPSSKIEPSHFKEPSQANMHVSST